MLDVLKVRRRHHDPLQGALRRKNHLLRAPARGVEDHVVHLVPLAVDLVVVVHGLHAGDAPIGVVVQRLLELALLGGKLGDDLLGRRGWLRDVHRAEARVQRHRRKAVLALCGCPQGKNHGHRTTIHHRPLAFNVSPQCLLLWPTATGLKSPAFIFPLQH